MFWRKISHQIDGCGQNKALTSRSGSKVFGNNPEGSRLGFNGVRGCQPRFSSLNLIVCSTVFDVEVEVEYDIAVFFLNTKMFKMVLSLYNSLDGS